MNKINRKLPWIASQQWHNVIFMHWPVPIQVIRKYIPDPFKVDMINGHAWVSIVCFQGTESRPRGIPSFLSVGPILQINVRTYVTLHDEPAIYFLSIDTNSLLFILGATSVLSLPYYKSYIKYSAIDHNSYRFVGRHEQHKNPYLDISFESKNERINNDLSRWLTERYCMYTVKGHLIIKVPISHRPWKLYDVHIKNHYNETILPHLNAFLEHPPIAHFATYKKAYLYPFETVAFFHKE